MIFCGYAILTLIHSIRLGALGGNHMSIASGVPTCIYVMIDTSGEIPDYYGGSIGYAVLPRRSLHRTFVFR